MVPIIEIWHVKVKLFFAVLFNNFFQKIGKEDFLRGKFNKIANSILTFRDLFVR